MTNPQDNPVTPSQPTPSDSSTPSPPSTTPQPRRRRVKMLARKTVASGALSKKLNEKLKASQVQDSDSFKSASEGEGPGSSNSEKAQKSPSKVSSSLTKNLEHRFVLVGPIRDVELPELGRSGGKKKSGKEKEREGECGEVRGKGKGVVDHSPTAELSISAIFGVVQKNIKESGKKSGGSGSRETNEGLLNLSSQGNEPGSSIGETTADLLKNVGLRSKEKKNSHTKTPSAAKPSKKRKVSSPTTTETDWPKGRATRSRVKKSESDLQKGRSTRSRVKQSESDLQKALAESKKKKMDKGKGKIAESSEAVDRTRSAVKGKQVRVSKDEEWSGEEENEFDCEQDKPTKFGKRNILKGRLLKDLVEPGMVRLVDTLAT
uniref:Uncharacterized protein n=1 Tax=Nicotiana tabacum TaxID=4097 RepID=A0A1S3X167_TOBAC|nr:PREDICTED: uncharacterized protein LOC107760161 [Nicotiana tabacum]